MNSHRVSKVRSLLSALIAALLIMLLLLTPRVAGADTPRVDATLDRNVVTLGDTATLTVNVTGSGQISDPRLPSLPAFTVYAAGRSQNVMVVNGTVSSSMSIHYILTPRQVGKYTIGPIQVDANGQTAQTSALSIEVVAGGAQARAPAPKPLPPPWPSVPRAYPRRQGPTPDLRGRGPAFVTASVDTKTPYVGQAITYTLRFYHSSGVTLRSNEFPNTTGFINEDLPPEKTYTTVIDGRPYQVNEVRVALFPTVEGAYKIGPDRLICRIMMNFAPHVPHVPHLPGFDDDDFGRVFGEVTERELKTDPIKVTVRPLPAEGRPDDFTGAVGNFVLDSHIDGAGRAKLGQALNLELTLTGEGNVNLIQALRLPPTPGFKTYPPVTSGSLSKEDYKVTGTRKFTFVLVPTKEGTLELPPISVSYFDPKGDGRYHTLTTKPMRIAVAPRPGSAPPLSGGSPATGAPIAPQAPALDNLDNGGLRPIHLQSALTSPQDLLSSPWFRAAQLVPLGVAGLALLLWGPRIPRRARPPRRGAALRRAQARLRQLPDDGALSSVMYEYLSDKLGTRATGLSRRELLETLQARGVSQHEVEQLEELLAASEHARYAPTQPEISAVRGRRNDVETLLTQLERSLR